MYLKAFNGKTGWGNCAEGLLFDTAVGGDAVGFDIGDGGPYGLSGIGPRANLRAAHAALLENARFMEQFYAKKGSFKLTSTKWPELPVKEAGGFCIRMSGQAKGILEGKFTLKAVALDREAEPRVLRLNESLTAVVCGKMKVKGSCTDGEEIFRGNDAECKPFTG